MADKEWEALVDPSSGATYYACEATGETSWEVPEGYTYKEGDPPMPQASGTGWSEATDPDSGATYYIHTDGRTTWEKPDDFDTDNAGGGGDAAAAADGDAGATAASGEAGEAGGDDWEEMTDPDSGATYYANNATGAVTWDKPAGFKPKGGDDAAAAAAADAPAPAPAPAPAAAATAPEPVAATAPPVPGGGAGASSTPSAGAGQGKGVLSPETLALWTTVANAVKAKAKAAIKDRASRFRSLRSFAAKNARVVRDGGTPGSASAGAGAGSGSGDKAAAAADSKTVWSFLNLPFDTPPRNSMEEYAENYFNLNRKGVFGKKTTVAKILSWKNDIIKTALRKMPSKDLNSQATQCFRNITGFMGDRSTGKEDGGHAEKLLKACLGAPEELRDEVYCQMVKQTTNNSRPDGNLKGWQLFSIATGAFPPSKTFEPYLLSYLHSHVEDAGGVGPLASYSLGRVKKAGELGPRRETPTAMEIDACKSALPVIIRVYLLDGTFHSMPVVSWTTAKDMNKMMAHKLGIKNDSAFACYEITPEGEERYLESDERLLDMVAYWQRLFEEEKGKAGKEKTSIVNLYRVAYKTHMYFDADAGDDAAERMLYIQAVYDVVSSRYPCNEEDTLTLAALQMQYEYEDDTLDGLEEPRKLKRFLPVKFAEGSRQAELAKEIQKRHAAHVTKTKGEAMKEYLGHVRKWKIYGSSFFYVEPQMSVDLPDEVFLAVNPKGVLIINPESKEVLAEHPYSEVPTWGHSGSSFVLHIGNLIRQTKLYFETEQGKEINNLVRSYVNHLCVA